MAQRLATDLGVFDLRSELDQTAARRIDRLGVVAARQHAEVGDLEVGQARLGRLELALVVEDLALDELARLIHVAAVGAEIALDEDRQQRLHHAHGQLRAVALVAHREQVLGLALGGDRDLALEAVDHRLALLR